MASVGGIATIDAVGLGLIGVFVVLGLVRGLWWQVIRLLGLFAAVLLARAFSPTVAPMLLERFPELSARAAHGVSWFGVFLVAMLAATLLGVLGRKLIEAMQLGLLDRLGGGLIGAATGFLVHVALLVAICQLGTEGFVARTVSGTHSEKVVDLLGSRFPVVLGKEAGFELDGVLRRVRGAPDAAPEDSPPSSDPPGTGEVVR